MSRKLRVRLLGDDWIAYGEHSIPEDRVIELSEEDAARYLRAAGTRKVEILGWIDTDDPDQAIRTV
jgi:hypothetical protein